MARFAWYQTFLWDEMTILTMILAVALGSFTGNFALIWVLGLINQHVENKKLKDIQNLQQQFIAARDQAIRDAQIRENARMVNYAKLEGYPGENS